MNRKNILIVDRDKDFMRELKEGLEPFRNSYQTAFAASIAKAHEILNRFTVHLVLANVQLSGESGIELLLHIRRWHTETHVVLYSGSLTEELKRSAYHSGAAAVIEHPFRIEELLRLLTRIFARESGSAFFDSVHLADLLQLIGMGHHSADVVVSSPADQLRGIIRIRKGNLIEAEAAEKRGVEAVAEMLSWVCPTIRTCRAASGLAGTSKAAPLHDVLMQAVARLDESRQTLPQD
ncbi:MAG: response regulator [Candidatus Electronema sp. V4]|uniref:response regulator n=1 Tax=Candidatus Electronema sp. V4 TaxID=3454756 RepID=UPI0040559388